MVSKLKDGSTRAPGLIPEGRPVPLEGLGQSLLRGPLAPPGIAEIQVSPSGAKRNQHSSHHSIGS